VRVFIFENVIDQTSLLSPVDVLEATSGRDAAAIPRRAAPKLIRRAFRVSVTNISFASPRCKYQTSNINSYDFIIRAISAAYRPMPETTEQGASGVINVAFIGACKAGKPLKKRDTFGAP
jgi:hypothetical protein